MLGRWARGARDYLGQWRFLVGAVAHSWRDLPGFCADLSWRTPRVRRVLMESPLAAPTAEEVLANVAYARRAMRDCLRRGEAPFASHLLYPQVLDDRDAAERTQGIEAGLLWGKCADATVVYVDRGISSGMWEGVIRATAEGRPVEYRWLGIEGGDTVTKGTGGAA